LPYHADVLTEIETPVYSRKAEGLLSDDEREEFAAFISQNPNLGSVVRGSGGVRKVRWARAGSGKSGGVRVIYYNQLAQEEIWLLTLYAKNERATIPAHELRLIKEAIERE
jgi:hypothetical protein